MFSNSLLLEQEGIRGCEHHGDIQGDSTALHNKQPRHCWNTETSSKPCCEKGLCEWVELWWICSWGLEKIIEPLCRTWYVFLQCIGFRQVQGLCLCIFLSPVYFLFSRYEAIICCLVFLFLFLIFFFISISYDNLPFFLVPKEAIGSPFIENMWKHFKSYYKSWLETTTNFFPLLFFLLFF